MRGVRDNMTRICKSPDCVLGCEEAIWDTQKTPSPRSVSLEAGDCEISSVLDEELPAIRKRVPKRKRGGNFRLSARYVMATYAQTGGIRPEHVCKFIEGIETVCRIFGVREDHQDIDGRHLHILVDAGVKRRFDIENPRKWDYNTYDVDLNPMCYHPNLKAGNLKVHGKYLMKDNPIGDDIYMNPLGWILEPGILKGLRQSVGEKLLAGMNVEEIIREYPSMYHDVKAMERVADLIERPRQRGPVKLSIRSPLCAYMAKHRSLSALAEWLTFDGDVEKRVFRSKHLYLYGQPHMGKTTFVTELAKGNNMYRSTNDGWWCGYSDKSYHFCVFDDYHGGIPVSDFNRFMCGMGAFRQKGGRTEKNDNIPCIVTSNIKPGDIYKNVPDYVKDAFVDRFTVIEVEQGVDLSKVFDHWPEAGGA